MTFELKGKVVVITGAASGIGQATAIAFAREGAETFLLDVDAKGLEETASSIRAIGARVTTRITNVAKADDMRAAADELHGKHACADVIVNNAGVAIGGGLLDTSLEDWSWILGVNVWGVVHGCHFFLPRMVARAKERASSRGNENGHVINISSVAGFAPVESLVAYCTTKFAVLGLSECLRLELGRYGIGASAICPGIINTPITRNSLLRGRYAKPGVQEKMIGAYQKRNYGPEKVAQAIVGAVRRDRMVVPVTPEAWAFYLAKRASPSLFGGVTKWLSTRFDPSK